MSGFKIFYMNNDNPDDINDFFRDFKILKWEYSANRDSLFIHYEKYSSDKITDDEVVALTNKYDNTAKKVNTKERKLRLQNKVAELEGKLQMLSDQLGETPAPPPPPPPSKPVKRCGFCDAPLPENKEDLAMHLDGECKH